MREKADAVFLAGELDQRLEKHRGVREEECSLLLVQVLRNHRGSLFGRPIVFLCIPFGFLLG
jgi:hypothetical protein